MGAARMRLNRLKDKLPVNGADIATTGPANTSRVKKDPRAATSRASATLKRKTPGASHDDEEDQSCVDLTTTEQTATKIILKAPRPIALSTPQKRKAPSASHESNEDQNFAKKVDSKRTAGKSSVGKRQTRAKKVNYTALYGDGDGDEEDDVQFTTVNSDSSDGDFNCYADEPDSGGLADLNIDKEESIKRSVKRPKKASPGFITGPIVKQSSSNRKKPTAAAKKTPVARPRRPAKPITLASRVPSIQKKAAPKALIPRFDRPLPSIEDSPPLSITSSDDESHSESDIDIKRLQPGTILSFGKNGGASERPNNKVNEQSRMQASRIAPTDVSRFFDPSDTASDASSQSSTGVGSNFQLELKNYAQEISPNDSISMVNERKGQGLGSLTTPSPPMTGK